MICTGEALPEIIPIDIAVIHIGKGQSTHQKEIILIIQEQSLSSIKIVIDPPFNVHISLKLISGTWKKGHRNAKLTDNIVCLLWIFLNLILHVGEKQCKCKKWGNISIDL